MIGLSAAIDPRDWSRTLDVAQKSKDLGIIIGVIASGKDVVSEENFRKLSSGQVTWFGNSKQHLRQLHQIMDSGGHCRLLEQARVGINVACVVHCKSARAAAVLLVFLMFMYGDLH